MNPKEKEMRQEAKERIIECLKNGYTGYYCDLHDEVFNKENFDELYTDLSDPEKLINMLFYIIGEEVLWEMLDDSETLSENWDNRANEETNAKILKELGE